MHSLCNLSETYNCDQNEQYVYNCKSVFTLLICITNNKIYEIINSLPLCCYDLLNLHHMDLYGLVPCYRRPSNDLHA